jgi:hypothetical protein
LVKSRDCRANRKVPFSKRNRQIKSRKGKLHGNCIREASSERISRICGSHAPTVVTRPPTVTIRPSTTSNHHDCRPTKCCRPYVPMVQCERFTRSDRIF